MAEPRQDRIDVSPAVFIPIRSTTSFGQPRLRSPAKSLILAVLRFSPASLFGRRPIVRSLGQADHTPRQAAYPARHEPSGDPGRDRV
jgi:hypothetical protein